MSATPERENSIAIRAKLLPIAYGAGLNAGYEWATEHATFTELEHLANEQDVDEIHGPFLAGFKCGCLQAWDEFHRPVA
jgi:hypothetical protein